jgi:hypothetical protein
MDEPDRRRPRLRAFVLGGALGASAAAAALRRARRRQLRQTPAGLAAFESAPCYREVLDKERSETP